MSVVSSSSCLSLVERNGSELAMKSTSRPGVSMFSAMVCNSSLSVGDCWTIAWNCCSTLRCNASSSGWCGGSTSSRTSAVATRYGCSCENSPSVTRSVPSAKTNRLWFGIFTILCTVASVPTLWRSDGCGLSTLASRCATTTMVFSSPRDWMSWMDDSRPTVRGRTACGNRTVSRTGRIGSGVKVFVLFVSSGIECPSVR